MICLLYLFTLHVVVHHIPFFLMKSEKLITLLLGSPFGSYVEKKISKDLAAILFSV